MVPGCFVPSACSGTCSARVWRHNGSVNILAVSAFKGTERSHLQNFVLGEIHMNQAKPLADDPGVPEYTPYPGRGGIGGNIIILGNLADKKVPYGPPYHIGLKPGGAQPFGDPQGITVQLPAPDAMLLQGVNLGLLDKTALFIFSITYQHCCSVVQLTWAPLGEQETF